MLVHRSLAWTLAHTLRSRIPLTTPGCCRALAVLPIHLHLHLHLALFPLSLILASTVPAQATCCCCCSSLPHSFSLPHSTPHRTKLLLLWLHCSYGPPNPLAPQRPTSFPLQVFTSLPKDIHIMQILTRNLPIFTDAFLFYSISLFLSPHLAFLSGISRQACCRLTTGWYFPRIPGCGGSGRLHAVLGVLHGSEGAKGLQYLLPTQPCPPVLTLLDGFYYFNLFCRLPED